MKAWLMDAVDTELRLEEDRERPVPGPGEVLIKVVAAGLCHSDVGYREGVIPIIVDLPIVLGHEVTGIVEEVGEGVEGFAVGDEVAQAAEVIGIEPREEVWDAAKQRGVTRVVKDVSELAGEDLDVVIDYAGFGETTVKAIDAVKFGGTVVLVGMGKLDIDFPTFDFITRAITLQGSTTLGKREHLEAVLTMIADGDLSIESADIGFDEIPDGLDRLAKGGVVGRLVARYDR